MRQNKPPLDLSRLKVWPLTQRKSMTRLDDILVRPESTPEDCSPEVMKWVQSCAKKIAAARQANASVIFMYGAHLIKNGASQILCKMIADGWITHLATNGAGVIHDWEFSFLGRSTESVRDNVATGSFGTWDETGRSIFLALMTGGLRGDGFGTSLGRFISEDGAVFPTLDDLKASILSNPSDPLTSARADLLQAMTKHSIPAGRFKVLHPKKEVSPCCQAYELGVPLTVHPGIGYDIITCHPFFDGGVVGRAGGRDFQRFAGAVEGLDNGVVISAGSAIMAPQVFEKSMSCVNNLRLQEGRSVVHNHSIYVVDLQDGGHWDWTQGEPPKTNPAYYLRFCKSFSRMGAEMQYVCSDHCSFIHHVYHQLQHL